MPSPSARKKAPPASAADKAEDYTRYSNLSAEKSILSLLIKCGADYWPRVEELNITENHFYVTSHRTLYRHLLHIHQTHGQLDLGSIVSLIPEEELTAIGGPGAIAEIYAYDSLTTYWDHYTSQLQETYHRRTTDNLLRKALTDLKNGFAEPSDIIRRLEDIQNTQTTHRPYIPMGRHGDSYVYYVPARGELITLAKNEHRPQALLALAPLTYWETRYGEMKAETATDECYRAQGNRLFSPDSARGIGTWKEGDNIIYNAGDKVYTYAPDGTHSERQPMGGGIIYERKSPILHPAVTPLTDTEAEAIATYIHTINWTTSESGLLLAGWLAIAPLAGCLRFRPHAWLNAPAGSGKSQLLDVIKHLLGTYALSIEGGTTEAGLRQTLRLDARCGIYDEAEANGENGIRALERIITYLRSCSTNEGGTILKGSTTGKALVSSPRSMFLFGSIGNQLERASDESRFATLTIRKIYDKAALAQHITTTTGHRAPLYATAYPARLLARTLTNAHTTLRNITIIRAYMIEAGEPGRRADLLSPLLAGYYSLRRSKTITLTEIKQLYSHISTSEIATIQETDEERCLNYLLQHITKDGWSISELITDVMQETNNWENCLHHQELKRYGIKIFKSEKTLAIANAHTKLSEIYEKSDWCKGWGKILRNLKGAQDRVNVRFSSCGSPLKATKIPLPNADN